MLGNQELILVGRRKHAAGIKFQSQRSNVRPQFLHGWSEILAWTFVAKLRILERALVTIRIAKMQSCLGCRVELANGLVVAQHVPALICDPQLLRPLMPGNADRITNTMRENL